MSIIALKRKSLAKVGVSKDSFSVWPTINSGQYNGSRIIPGLSSIRSIPYCGYEVPCKVNQYNSSKCCKSYNPSQSYKNNIVKTYKYSDQDDYIRSKKNSCYVHFNQEQLKSDYNKCYKDCNKNNANYVNSKSLNYKSKLGNYSSDYDDYIRKKLINCNNYNNSSNAPKVWVNGESQVSAYMVNKSSFRNVCVN